MIPILNKLKKHGFICYMVVNGVVFSYLNISQLQFNNQLVNEIRALAQDSLENDDYHPLQTFKSNYPVDIYIMNKDEQIYFSSMVEHKALEHKSTFERYANRILEIISHQDSDYYLGIEFFDTNYLVYKQMTYFNGYSLLMIGFFKTSTHSYRKLNSLVKSNYALKVENNLDKEKIEYFEDIKQMQADTNLKKEQIIGSLIHNLKSTLIDNRIILDNLSNIYPDSPVLNEIDNNNELILSDVNKIIDIAYDKELLDLNNQSQVNLDKLLLDTYQLYRKQFYLKDIHVQFILEECNHLYINPMALKIIAYNLFSNIATYADEKASVLIETITKGENMLLKFYNDVSDINLDNLTKLQESHINEKSNTYSNGTGLYTVKAIVKEIGGQLLIEKENKGLSITIILPNKLN